MTLHDRIRRAIDPNPELDMELGTPPRPAGWLLNRLPTPMLQEMTGQLNDVRNGYLNRETFVTNWVSAIHWLVVHHENMPEKVPLMFRLAAASLHYLFNEGEHHV